MKNSIYKTILGSSVALAACVIASVPAFAQSPLSEKEAATRINAANGLLREGKVDDAIAAYREVVPGEQQENELNYNLAVAEYRKGNIDSAGQLFNDVAGCGDAKISADSRYNLGNCQYAKAVELAEKDKPAAIERLRQAISNYRGSLRGNPNNSDARANIELAGELIRKLDEEQKQEDQQKQDQQQDQQQKQQQKQDQKQDEQQDKNKKDQQDKKDQSEQEKSDQQQQGDEQKNQQDKSEKSESQQSDSKQGESKEEKSQEASEQQKSGSQESKSENKSDEQKKQDETSDEQKQDEQKQDQQKDGNPEQPSRGQNQKQPQNQRQQSGQQQPEDQGQPEEQEAKNQQIPGGELKAAGEQDENKQPDGSVAMADPNAKDGLMTREEALKMLQAVRDRDMLRRMQQQRQEQSRHVSVDRDW